MFKCQGFHLLYFMIIVLSFVLLIYIIVTGNEMQDHGETAMVIVGNIFILYRAVWIKRADSLGEKAGEIEKRLETLYNGKEEQERLYMQIRLCRKNISYMRHDLANHMQVVELFSGKDRKDNLNSDFKNIENILKKTSIIKYCSNTMFDIAIEQKINELQNSGIKVETDIRLNDVKDEECYELCMIFWLLIDNAVWFMDKGKSISIKMYSRDIGFDDGRKGIAYKIEGYPCYVKEKKIRKSPYVHIINILLKRVSGSIIINTGQKKIVEAGMAELSKR